MGSKSRVCNRLYDALALVETDSSNDVGIRDRRHKHRALADHRATPRKNPQKGGGLGRGERGMLRSKCCPRVCGKRVDVRRSAANPSYTGNWSRAQTEGGGRRRSTTASGTSD